MPPNDTIPHGYCHCGCGERTTIAPCSDARKGMVKGQPMRFRPGHQHCRVPFNAPRYVVDPETDCWIWQGANDGHGYGQIRVGKHTMHATRWMWERERGPIPEGFDLDHVVCRNPPCVNPSHLEPVPRAINVRRGRVAKLTPTQVAEIRALAGTAPHREIAKRYGVARSTISRLLRGDTWFDDH